MGFQKGQRRLDPAGLHLAVAIDELDVVGRIACRPQRVKPGIAGAGGGEGLGLVQHHHLGPGGLRGGHTAIGGAAVDIDDPRQPLSALIEARQRSAARPRSGLSARRR